VDIRSTPSATTRQTGAGRARDAAPAAAPRAATNPPAPAAGPPVDRVELSAAARELNARLDAAQATGGLSAERTRQLAERIRTGFYDRPDTIDRIIARVLGEFTRTDSRE
jgi:hypothetical protein